MFSSAIAFSLKAASGIGSLAAGIALDLIAFPRGAATGAVPAEKITQLGMAVGPGLMVFYLLTLIFMSRYRMTRERHREILDQLAERNAAGSAGASA
jgi:Na+/melibiose symporter-like transporter